MTDREFEVFITKFINSVKSESEDYKKQILDGGLEQRDYDRMCGILTGMDQLVVNLLTKAKEALNNV